RAARAHRILQDRKHEPGIPARLDPHALEDVGDRRAPGEGRGATEWDPGERLDGRADARILARRGRDVDAQVLPLVSARDLPYQLFQGSESGLEHRFARARDPTR